MLEAQSDCVVFFDEIDAFLLDRDSKHYRPSGQALVSVSDATNLDRQACCCTNKQKDAQIAKTSSLDAITVACLPSPSKLNGKPAIDAAIKSAHVPDRPAMSGCCPPWPRQAKVRQSPGDALSEAEPTDDLEKMGQGVTLSRLQGDNRHDRETARAHLGRWPFPMRSKERRNRAATSIILRD